MAKPDELIAELTELLALQFAIKAHGDQKRKYTGEPYVVHVKRVAELVKTVSHTPEMVAAEKGKGRCLLTKV